MQVLLIDDHSLFREGMALLLRPLVDPLGIWEAGSCEEAFAMLRAQGLPDLILMDLGLPGMSGIDGLRELATRYPETPLVALSSADDKATVLDALDAGAMGFIPKSSTSSVLMGALRLIMAKGIYLPPSVFLAERTLAPRCVDATDTVNHQGCGPDRAPGRLNLPVDGREDHGPVTSPPQRTCRPADLGLTPRQADVLYQILQGKSVKLIGRDLGLSPSTVKAHISVVLRALNVTTRTQAVIAAGRLGLRFEQTV